MGFLLSLPQSSHARGSLDPEWLSPWPGTQCLSLWGLRGTRRNIALTRWTRTLKSSKVNMDESMIVRKRRQRGRLTSGTITGGRTLIPSHPHIIQCSTIHYSHPHCSSPSNLELQLCPLSTHIPLCRQLHTHQPLHFLMPHITHHTLLYLHILTLPTTPHPHISHTSHILTSSHYPILHTLTSHILTLPTTLHLHFTNYCNI